MHFSTAVVSIALATFAAAQGPIVGGTIYTKAEFKGKNEVVFLTNECKELEKPFAHNVKSIDVSSVAECIGYESKGCEGKTAFKLKKSQAHVGHPNILSIKCPHAPKKD